MTPLDSGVGEVARGATSGGEGGANGQVGGGQIAKNFGKNKKQGGQNSIFFRASRAFFCPLVTGPKLCHCLDVFDPNNNVTFLCCLTSSESRERVG